MSIDEALEQLEGHESNVRFRELVKICKEFFGEPRTCGSHQVFKMPWAGNPRINLQDTGGKAKAYQVRDVIKALVRLKG